MFNFYAILLLVAAVPFLALMLAPWWRWFAATAVVSVGGLVWLLWWANKVGENGEDPGPGFLLIAFGTMALVAGVIGGVLFRLAARALGGN